MSAWRDGSVSPAPNSGGKERRTVSGRVSVISSGAAGKDGSACVLASAGVAAAGLASGSAACGPRRRNHGTSSLLP